MLDWGFSTFSGVTAVRSGEILAEAGVINGEEKTVGLCARQALSYPVSAGDQWALEIHPVETLEAPVSAGQEAGYAVLRVNGEEAARSELTACRSVEKRSLLTWLKRLLGL